MRKSGIRFIFLSFFFRYQISSGGSLVILTAKYQQLFICVAQNTLNKKIQSSPPFLVKSKGNGLSLFIPRLPLWSSFYFIMLQHNNPHLFSSVCLHFSLAILYGEQHSTQHLPVKLELTLFFLLLIVLTYFAISSSRESTGESKVFSMWVLILRHGFWVQC